MRRSGALTLLAGGLAGAARPAFAQTGLPVVRIGTLAIDAGGQAYYGTDTGIFAANGITPQVVTLTAGAAIVAAILGGDLEVGASNPLQVAVAIARGIPLVMIAPGCLYSKRDASPNLFVAKNSPITKPKDLTGATLGVGTLGDFNQLSLFAWLDANHVPRESVKYVELKFSEMAAALQRGTVQAGLMAAPAKTEALAAGLVREFADTYLSIMPEFSPLVWVASRSWVQKNPRSRRASWTGCTRRPAGRTSTRDVRARFWRSTRRRIRRSSRRCSGCISRPRTNASTSSRSSNLRRAIICCSDR